MIECLLGFCVYFYKDYLYAKKKEKFYLIFLCDFKILYYLKNKKYKHTVSLVDILIIK